MWTISNVDTFILHAFIRLLLLLLFRFVFPLLNLSFGFVLDSTVWASSVAFHNRKKTKLNQRDFVSFDCKRSSFFCYFFFPPFQFKAFKAFNFTQSLSQFRNTLTHNTHTHTKRTLKCSNNLVIESDIALKVIQTGGNSIAVLLASFRAWTHHIKIQFINCIRCNYMR